MVMTVREKLESGPMFDSAIVEHHFTPYLRDYDVLVDVPAADPGGSGSYIEGRYRYRFSHCVHAEITTAVSPDTWRVSWDDVFIDFDVWEKSGSPDGYVWDVCFSNAYPGLSYIEKSTLAEEWSKLLGKPMHEVFIETNGHGIRLVFYEVDIKKIAHGDSLTRSLTPINESSDHFSFR
jgi:hypothetical protein